MKLKRTMKYLLPTLFAMVLTQALHAESFVLPNGTDNLVGRVQEIASVYEDTFTRLARNNNLGYMEVRLANPTVDPWLPGTGTAITLPKQYILPDAPHEGIVINLAEMRLYYYPPVVDGQPARVETFPIGIGREAFPTPELSSRVRARIPNPAWYPPQSIIDEHAARGSILPRTVPPGPDNPLGDYAIALEIPGYFIHGTNRSGGVGLRVSHGCIRMYPEDIEWLFNQVSIGTPVRIVHQPIKVGVLNGEVYLESHPATQDGVDSLNWQVTSQMARLVGSREVVLDWDLVDRAALRADGIPTRIARLSPPAEQLAER